MVVCGGVKAVGHARQRIYARSCSRGAQRSRAQLPCTAPSVTLRPGPGGVRKQLDPEVVALVNELPEADHPNKEIVGRLFAHGGLSHAKMGKDGVMRDRVAVPANQYIWKPAIIVMERAGDLELEFQNEDQNFHVALLPSDGERQVLELPRHTGGRARIRLDQPGLYWFGCPVANHAGRGMLGLVIVRGDAPATARLDRPKQPRPGRN
jgi:PQQ system protein